MGRKKTGRIKEWPRIRVKQMRSKTVWEVDTGSKLKERIRKKFDAPEMAATFAERLRAEHHNEGMSAFDLTIGQKQDAREALALLDGQNVALKDAVRFFIVHHQPPGGKKTVREVCAELLEYKKDRQKCRSFL